MRSARIALLLLFVATAAVILCLPQTPHAGTFLLLAEYGLLLPALVLAFRTIPRTNGGELPVPPILLTLAVFLALNLLVRTFITQDVAAGDESAYHFQARLFAQGMVAAEAPPDVQVGDWALRSVFRFHHHAMTGDRWLTQYPPGWPALLTVAWRLNLDWLVNPLLGACILVLTWRIGSLLYSPRTGALAAAMMALSLSFVHQTSGYLSHPSCGAFLIAATYFYLRARQAEAWRYLTLSVVCLAAASLVRPYTGFCVGIVLGALLLTEARKRGILLRFGLLATGVGVAWLSLYLGYNLHVHGRLSSYTSGGWSTGEIFAGSPFELGRSVVLFTRWSIQSTMLYGFPFLLPLAALVLLADREHRFSAWLLAALVLSLVAGYSATKVVSGVYFGERYYYEMYFALCLLGARGLLVCLESRLPAVLRVAGPVLMLCLVAYGIHAALYVQRASEIFTPYVAIRDAAQAITERNSVVFLPVNLGRDINLNAPAWRQAASVYLEDPGELLRGPVTAVLGRRTWYVIAYDPTPRKAPAARHTLP